MGQAEDDDHVGEDRAGIIEGETAETHPQRADEDRQGDMVDFPLSGIASVRFLKNFRIKLNCINIYKNIAQLLQVCHNR